jgi:hypothetical protein
MTVNKYISAYEYIFQKWTKSTTRFYAVVCIWYGQIKPKYTISVGPFLDKIIIIK